MAANDYPLPTVVKPIGGPYEGTHGKAFNVRGGSDNWESENAVDLPTPEGTPVYAVVGGKIGNQIGPGGTGRFAGNRLHLISPNNEYYYAHLSKLVVKAGQTVTIGQLLGYSGSANGVAHLHFAAKVGDPRDVFNGNLPSGTTSSTGHTTDTTSTKKSGTAVPATDAAGVPLGPDDPELANAISAIPQGQGAATVEAALAGDPQDQATPPPSNAQTWQMIAGQGQVSPLTLQLAQLAGYSANATATG